MGCDTLWWHFSFCSIYTELEDFFPKKAYICMLEMPNDIVLLMKKHNHQQNFRYWQNLCVLKIDFQHSLYVVIQQNLAPHDFLGEVVLTY